MAQEEGDAAQGAAEVTPEMLLALKPRFLDAYDAWRDHLADDDLNGLPVAPGTGDCLFQAFLQNLRSEGR